jgi:flavin reductase (DIM6/NTAB) family NADH-FMN oxidoreductase RutF
VPNHTPTTDPASQEPAGIELEELQAVFRNAMAGVATPVSVVTALKDGKAHGTTVSAFASLSMNPPMVMVALDRSSDLLRKGSDKFNGIPWAVDTGLPRLPGASWVACSVESLVDGGDHVIALGSVLKVDLGDGKPLTYCQRTFGTHASIPG